MCLLDRCIYQIDRAEVQHGTVCENIRRNLCFIEKQVCRGIAVEGKLAVAVLIKRNKRQRGIRPSGAEHTRGIHAVCAQRFENVRTECVLSHLRNHLRSAAETRHCGCHIGRRTARDTLKLHDLIKRTAALLRHEINEQFADCHYFFHRSFPPEYVGKSPVRRRFPYCCR